MSSRQIARSPDLLRLVAQGYALEVRGACLLVHLVPQVTAERIVAHGSLVMSLTLAGDVTSEPDDHTARWIGAEPCDADGRPLAKIITGGSGELGGIAFNFTFSAKPKPADRYPDYEQKVNAYVARIAGPARQLDPEATALTFIPLIDDPEDSPFVYTDTATPRAGLEQYADRLRATRIAIVGVGGSGSFVLDATAKTSVAAIHLFDGDRFLQHNAFRAPGPISCSELLGAPNKATFWARRYAEFRRGVEAHPYRITAENVGELRGFDFVFVAVDDGPSRDLITRALEEFGVSFVDIGLGVNDVDDRLSAKLRVSTGTPTHRVDRSRLPVAAAGPENEYRHNIQIAELNAASAMLAVIKWKKLAGVYADLEREHFSTYATVVNSIVNSDQS
jgi:molybdopterin/thiamine biosynthesis adenylyltransferase